MEKAVNRLFELVRNAFVSLDVEAEYPVFDLSEQHPPTKEVVNEYSAITKLMEFIEKSIYVYNRSECNDEIPEIEDGSALLLKNKLKKTFQEYYEPNEFERIIQVLENEKSFLLFQSRLLLDRYCPITSIIGQN